MKKNSIVIIGLCFFVLQSCQKNIDIVEPSIFVGSPDTAWVTTIPNNSQLASLKTNLAISFTADSFVYNNIATTNTAANVTLAIPANALVKGNGLAANGTVNGQTQLLQKKGDFIRMNVQTISNNILLTYAGALYKNLKQNDSALQIAQGKKIEIKFPNSNIAFQQNLQVYHASVSNDGYFNWLANTDSATNTVTTVNNGYQFNTNKLPWLQVAKPMEVNTSTQTVIKIKLPPNYTNSNTAAFIVFNDVNCVVNCKADVDAKKFISPALPANKSITIVVLSKQVTDYYLGYTQTITTNTNSMQEVIVTPTLKPLSNINSYLSTL